MRGMRWGYLALGLGMGWLACAGAACGSSGGNASAVTGGDGGAGDGGAPGADAAPAEGGDAAAGPTALSFPQLVHGAARVDRTAFPTIPLVVTATGGAPAAVHVTIDGASAVSAVSK